MTAVHTGACHCGAITVAFRTGLAAGALTIRACQCSFCRRHGVKAVADPAGSLRIEAKADGLMHYRFGLQTADFLICRDCGCYVAAMIDTAGQRRATLNVSATAIAGLSERPAEPVSYDGESVDERKARRLRSWTPVEIIDVAHPRAA